MAFLGGKQRRRSYLLPGMGGGRAHRRKRKLILVGAVIIGLGVAVILAGLMCWLDRLSF